MITFVLKGSEKVIVQISMYKKVPGWIMNIMNRLIYCKRKKERKKNSNSQQQQLILFTKICGWGWRLTTQSLSTLAHQTRKAYSLQCSHHMSRMLLIS